MCLDVTSWGPKEWERYQLLYIYIYICINPHQQELSYKSYSFLCHQISYNKTLKSAQVIFCSAFQTSLLQGHLNRNLRYVATLNKEHLSSFTINTVQVYGQEKYLLVSDWNWKIPVLKFWLLKVKCIIYLHLYCYCSSMRLMWQLVTCWIPQKWTAMLPV